MKSSQDCDAENQRLPDTGADFLPADSDCRGKSGFLFLPLSNPFPVSSLDSPSSLAQRVKHLPAMQETRV